MAMNFRSFYVSVVSRLVETRAIPTAMKVGLLVAFTKLFFGSEAGEVIRELQNASLKRKSELMLREYRRLLQYEQTSFDFLTTTTPPAAPEMIAAVTRRLDLLRIIVKSREEGAPNLFAEGAWRIIVEEFRAQIR